MKSEPIGIFYGGYSSGPTNAGICIPFGSCIIYSSERKIALTATHVLDSVKKELNVHTEIKPTFDRYLIGIDCGDKGWQQFEVLEYHEILPDITALYLSETSVANIPFPDEMPFPMCSERIGVLSEVHLVGYPASIQKVEIVPDEDLMEVTNPISYVFNYAISGMVCNYFKKHSPSFIPSDLLPAFTVDNGVLPGMSGGAVMRNIRGQREIVGMIVKNIQVSEGDMKIVHSLGLCLNDVTLP